MNSFNSCFRCSISLSCIGYIAEPPDKHQCRLLYQATDYSSSLANLTISSEDTVLLRYDLYLARIEKQLCDEVHPLPNLAPDGIATKSSESAFVSCPCNASRAIDNNPAYKWDVGSCSVTDDADNQWWMLDLQETADVEIVRLSNRETYHQRLSNFEIRIGMNAINISENTLCYKMDGIAPAGTTTNFPCLNVTRGRYLSIQRFAPYGAHGKYLHICEVQVIPPISDTKHINIAPYGIASQSSTYTQLHGYASRAIDGFIDPDWWNGYDT